MLGALAACGGGSPIVAGACAAVPGAGVVLPAAGSLAGGAADAVAGAALDAAGQWVVTGAVWLLGRVGQVLSATTSVGLDTAWFRTHEAVMAGLGAAVVVPMVCCAAIQAVVQQSTSMLLRSFLLYLPLSVLLTGVAVTLVRLGLALTDALSAQILAGAGVQGADALSPLGVALAGGATGPGGPGFVTFAGGLLLALAALVLWVELAVRAAAVAVAVLFLPLALAALVWPAVSHWCRRLADTLVALVLSKLVMVAVLALGLSALIGGLGGSADGGGFAAVVSGLALLLLSTLAPYSLLRLVPAVEAGAALHLEAARSRLVAAGRSAATFGGGELRAMVGAAPEHAAQHALEVVRSPSSGAPTPTASTGRGSDPSPASAAGTGPASATPGQPEPPGTIDRCYTLHAPGAAAPHAAPFGHDRSSHGAPAPQDGAAGQSQAGDGRDGGEPRPGAADGRRP